MRKLFLASEAKHPKTVKDIEEFVGGFKDKRIAYIPTAVNGDKPWYDWREGGSARMIQSLGAEVEFVELDKEEDTKILQSVRNADVIWMAGGMGGYLMYWLNRTGLSQEIPKLVEKGIFYIGSSAGSWVCQKRFSAEVRKKR